MKVDSAVQASLDCVRQMWEGYNKMSFYEGNMGSAKLIYHLEAYTNERVKETAYIV